MKQVNATPQEPCCMHIEPQHVAERMMRWVYVPFSMVISLDAHGYMLDLCQVDTQFGAEHIILAPDAAQIWLLTNHPEGQIRLNEWDVANLSWILDHAGSAQVYVFVAGEDVGCHLVWTGKGETKL